MWKIGAERRGTASERRSPSWRRCTGEVILVTTRQHVHGHGGHRPGRSGGAAQGQRHGPPAELGTAGTKRGSGCVHLDVASLPWLVLPRMAKAAEDIYEVAKARRAAGQSPDPQPLRKAVKLRERDPW